MNGPAFFKSGEVCRLSFSKCHLPQLADATDDVAKEIVKNVNIFMDPKASDDAKHKAEQQLTKVSINCLVCHQRNAITHKWVDGFPQKKTEELVSADTQEGMKRLVEKFFSENFRDVTSRESIEWGKVTKTDDGNFSIRYKYRARLWDKDIKIMNQIFTFDPKGKFVAVKNVEGFPRNP